MKKVLFVGLAIALLFSVASDFKSKDNCILVDSDELMRIVEHNQVK